MKPLIEAPHHEKSVGRSVAFGELLMDIFKLTNAPFPVGSVSLFLPGLLKGIVFTTSPLIEPIGLLSGESWDSEKSQPKAEHDKGKPHEGPASPH
jgi:hypothetical protein